MNKSIVVVLASIVAAASLHAQTTAFIYQGRLNDNGAPASGTYDLRFTVCDAATDGSVVSLLQTNSAVAVSNGLFTAQLDFGANVFDGSSRWLEIGVHTNGDPGPFVILSPRQPITSSPYSIQAANANVANSANAVSASNILGTIFATQLPSNLVTNGATGLNLSGTFVGDGSGLTSLPATNLTGTLNDARLSTNIALRIGGNILSGNQIIENGRVGIGTNNPQGQLDVVSPDGFAPGLGVSLKAGRGAAGQSQQGWPGGSMRLFSGDGGTGDFAQNGGAGGDIILKPGSGGAGGSFGGVGGRSGGVAIGKDVPNAMLDVNGAIVATSFAGNGSGLTNLNGANISSGTLSASQIPNLDASKITSGTLSVSRIPDLDAAKITTGTISTARLSNVALTSGNNSFSFGTNEFFGRVNIYPVSSAGGLHIIGPSGTQLVLQEYANLNRWSIYTESTGNLLFVPSPGGAYAYINKPTGNFTSSSDVRLKKDIHSLDPLLDRVLKLRPVSYRFRTQAESEPLSFGFIAQEVEPLFPEIVGEHDGMKGLAYSQFAPLTVQAIQELNEKLETSLREKDAQMEKLQRDNQSLETRLQRLEQILSNRK